MTGIDGVAEGIRPPRQERSRASLERVLAAGAQLLAEQGYEAFTVSEIARRAGATTGLIYTRFENKAALFEAVLLRELSRMVQEETATLDALASANLPTPSLVDRTVRVLAEIARREAPLTKVFMERTTLDPALAEHVRRLRTAPRQFTAMLSARREELAHDDSERAGDMAFWLVTSALERRVHTEMWRHWDAEAAEDWEQFVADLVRAVQAFLLYPPVA
jgi:AcrR family transcriptional regulator